MTVTDNVGRTVQIPVGASRVATIGAVPQLNTYLFALGRAGAIVNGLGFARSSRWRFQQIFAPALATNPDISGSHGVYLDRLRQLDPDFAIVKLAENAEALGRETDLPILVLPPLSPDTILHGIRVLADIFGETARADRYQAYFDHTLARVRAACAGITAQERPSVLYLNLAPPERRGLIMEWVIPQAGGRSVLESSTAVPHPFTIGELLDWDPDVLVCMEPDSTTQLMTDPTFEKMTAVRNGRVHTSPTGGHGWGNGTPEQPLSLIWLGQILHPERFADFNLAKEASTFYREFFDTSLAADQIDQILTGRR